jgi:hypothetical protein
MAKAAGTNGLTCLPKHGGTQDNKFLVTHSMTDQRYLTSSIHRAIELLDMTFIKNLSECEEMKM